VVARRLLLLLAVLMLMAALAAQISPPPERLQRTDRDPLPSPTATSAPVAGDVIEKTIQVGGDGSAVVESSLGDTVRLTFESDSIATVEIEGLDKIENVQPESPAIVELYTDRAGSYPIVVLESAREIARLEVAGG
jgi:hypothetical protein